jgi:uroporphyrinogen decarboxylase
MMKMASEPAVAEACLDQILRFSLTYVEGFLDGCGDALDILYLADDFASQRGLLMRPQQWRTLLKPRYAKLFELGKRRGLPIWFHSCGDITAVLPDLIDIGLDVWETVQLHALPMPAAELKRRFGRHVTFFGGINTQRLPFATPAAVQAEVVAVCRALGPGGGFICGPDHHLKPDVPPANALALFTAARGFRQAGITRD